MAFEFSPNELHRLNRLAFRLRLNPAEQAAGDRRIRRSGDGYDFMDYRPYTRGDDVRRIDWSLYGRFRQLFVRIHESPRQASIAFLLDSSRSMGFGEPLSKLQQAQRILCGLSFVALRGGDRVFFSGFSTSAQPIQGPFHGVRRHKGLVDELQKLEALGESQMFASVQQLAARRLHRGLVVILSDFLGTGDVERTLSAISGAGGKVMAIQVLSPAVHLPSLRPGTVRLRDSETNRIVRVQISQAMLDSYREQFTAREEILKRQFARRGYTFLQASVADDCLAIISHALCSGAVRP